MPSKFFRLAISLLFAPLLHAQTPAPSESAASVSPAAASPAASAAASPGGTPEKHAYVRFWNMSPAKGPELDLSDSPNPDDKPLFSQRIPWSAGPYVPIKIGKYPFILYKTGDHKQPIQSISVILRENVFVTFLATDDQGRPKIELIDDTYDPAAVNGGQVVVRNYFPGASVDLHGPKKKVLFTGVATGQAQHTDDFPLKKQQIVLHTVLNGNTPADAGMEVNFKRTPHVTVLIFPDTYGYFHPTLQVDGIAPD